MTISHSALASSFKNGATVGSSSTMFINDQTIYSYGYHFPIAKRVGPDEYLFNPDSYSVTTSGHKSAVWSALYHSKTWDCPKCDPARYGMHAKYLIEEVLRKIPNARSNFHRHVSHLIQTIEDYYAFKKRFKLKDNGALEPLVNPGNAKAIDRIRESAPVEALQLSEATGQKLSKAEYEYITTQIVKLKISRSAGKEWK